MTLACYLSERIRQHKPDAKVPRSPKDMQPWAREVDLMLRVDKRPVETVRAVIDYATHSSFWRSVVLSAGKLRQKFHALDIQRLEDANGTRSKRHPGTGGSRYAQGGAQQGQRFTPDYYAAAQQRLNDRYASTQAAVKPGFQRQRAEATG